MSASVPAVKDASLSSARLTPLPGAQWALMLLLTINLFNYIDRYVLASTLTSVSHEFFPQGVANTKKLEGLLQTAFIVSYMVLAPVFAWMSNRWSRWKIMAVGIALWSLASGASGLATGFVMLLVTRAFVGVGEAAYGPAAPTVISDLYPVAIRGRVLAWFYAAIPVGSAIGFGWGGLLDAALGWRWAFYLVVPPGLALAAICLLMPETPRGQADLDAPIAPRALRWENYKVLLRTPSWVLNTLGMAAMTFAIGGIAFWMPDYILEYRGQLKVPADKAYVNLTFGAILVVAGLSATLVGGWVGDRLRPRFAGSYFLVSGLAMLVAFPLFLAALYAPFPWAWVFIFLACFCLFFNTGPTNTILANVTHPAIRASGFAVNILVIHLLGDAISPFLIGAISDATGPVGQANMNAGFLAVSGMILIGAALWLWGARYLKNDTERAPFQLEQANASR